MVAQVAGPGKKQCPGCNTYVGVRTRVCECGHAFGGGSVPTAHPVPPPRKVPVKSSEPRDSGAGRGKKQCPECKNYMGIRTKKCECGHEFVIANPTHPDPTHPDSPAPRATPVRKDVDVATFFQEDDTPEPEPGVGRLRKVLIGAGKCPVRLTGTEREDVEIWAHSVIEKGRQQGVYYEVPALKYWAREFHEIGSPMHKQICEILDEVFVPVS